jgi:hypothetical protein
VRFDVATFNSLCLMTFLRYRNGCTLAHLCASRGVSRVVGIALQHLIAKQGMLANLDKGASQRPNPLNPALRRDPPPELPEAPDQNAHMQRASLLDPT